jgi:hypothetical protein
MKRFNREAFRKYRRNYGRIDGWIHPFTAWFMFELSHGQSSIGVSGSIAEIGVHHGKSFLPMYLGTEQDEFAIAIDLFEQQSYNKDGSGKGDRDKFLGNLKAVAGNEQGLRIIARRSESVEPEEILQSSLVRLFSIDGSHSEEATYSDLSLAASVLSAGGAILLDDLFNHAWPEVLGGTARFLTQAPQIIPAFVLPGKIMLCRVSSVDLYHGWCWSKFRGWVDFEKRLFGHKVLGVGLNGSFARRRIRNTPFGNRIAALKKRIIPG